MNDLISAPLLPLAVGVGLLLFAGYWESRTLKVPNLLTLGALLAAMIFATAKTILAPGTPGGLGATVVGTVVGGALLLPLYLRFGLGAGCVKTQAAFGGWMSCAMGAEIGIKLLIVATICACVTLAANSISHQPLAEDDPEDGKQIIHGQLPLSVGAVFGIVATTWL